MQPSVGADVEAGPAQPVVPAQRPESAVADIARRLLAHIADEGLAPGGRLPPERQLAAALGVGRAAVREALAALDLLGLVHSRQGSGTYLTGRTADLLPQAVEWGLVLGKPETLHLVEARHHLEIALSGIAARRRTPEALVRLQQHLQQMHRTGQAGEIDAFVHADVAFHLEVAATSGSTVLAGMLDSVRSLLGVWMSRAVRADCGHVEDTLAEHAAIVEAIAAGAVEEAENTMRVHMSNAESRLMRTLGHDGWNQQHNGAAT
ncbi:FadR/GntR family transcriptional regulator [Kineococcus sp. SYSU DK006]|uniref:FadR/GntR family transcriptional regulator n=1 Tax=Kineococcus sp. SYSU DK006 TaxID=3383127 RepID=UPI003D7E9346